MLSLVRVLAPIGVASTLLIVLRPDFGELPFVGLPSDGFVWGGGLALLFGLISIRSRPTIYIDDLSVIAAAIVAAAVFAALYLIHGRVDSEMLRRMASLPVSAAVAYCVVQLVRWSRWPVPVVVGGLLVVAAALQGAIVFAQTISPTFHESIRDVLAEPSRTNGPAYLYWSALRPQGGDAFSSNQALVLWAAVVLILTYQREWLRTLRPSHKMVGLCLIGIGLLGTFISGRTGLYLLVGMVITAGALKLALYPLKPAKIRRRTAYIGFGIVVAVGVLVLQLMNSEQDYSPLGRLLSPGHTTSALLKQYASARYVPNNLLIGTGEFGREGSVYIRADSGWLRIFYGSGLVGTVAILIPFALAVVLARPRKPVWWLVAGGMVVHLKVMYLPSILFTTLFFVVFFLGTQQCRTERSESVGPCHIS